VTTGAGAAATENDIEPEGTPPTAQDSCQEPIVELSSVPDFEKLPELSVDPMDVPENLPLGMEPLTVTGAFGVAPVMDTCHVSPT
jgi:hypothetical protein